MRRGLSDRFLPMEQPQQQRAGAHRPVSITTAGERALRIVWDDGVTSALAFGLLRRRCPCATCNAQAASKPASYIPLFSPVALQLERVTPIGHYALQFVWRDGHDTGIYSYEYLRSLDAQGEAAR
jgi:DUF971 family protein